MNPVERYVLVGLARAQQAWFADVARWATSSAIPADFVKTSSVDELTVLLRSGRRFSAVLVGSSVVGWDRDLAGLAAAQGCAVVVVEDRISRPSLVELSQTPPAAESELADGVLAAPFKRQQLVDVLGKVARPLVRPDDAVVVGLPAHPGPGACRPESPSGDGGGGPEWRGLFVAVTGAGGTGKSTLAMALARGLAADPRDRRHVALADLALRAQQAVLHDSGDVLPGLPELLDAHRYGALAPDRIRSLCFEVPDGGYDVLLGLRNRREWTTVRSHAAAAALEGLRSAYRMVVADVDADVEGEEPTGSLDVEERNSLARLSLAQADLVVVVGRAGATGIHAQVELLAELVAFGVAPARILPVVNRAPRWPGRRAEARAALATHAGQRLRDARFAANPCFVNERRRLDDVVADGGAVPVQIRLPLARTVRVLLDRLDGSRPAGSLATPGRSADPVRVEPGSVGRWTEELTGDLRR